jgi:hypothetical protein
MLHSNGHPERLTRCSESGNLQGQCKMLSRFSARMWSSQITKCPGDERRPNSGIFRHGGARNGFNFSGEFVFPSLTWTRGVPVRSSSEGENIDADIGFDAAREIREYYIPDFSNWKDHDSYKAAFDKLLKGLKANDHTPS